MEALRAAVDGVLSRDPHPLADSELSAELAELRRWEHVIDADGFLTDADRRYQRRFLNLSQGWDGMWHLDGLQRFFGRTSRAAKCLLCWASWQVRDQLR